MLQYLLQNSYCERIRVQMSQKKQNRSNYGLFMSARIITIMLISFIHINNAHSACIVPVSSDTVSHFIKDPSAVLLSHTNRNDNIALRVRVLATAGIGSLKAIEKAIPKANLVQKTAIGEGLARANTACNARDGEISHRINDVVRRVADRDVTRSYLKSLTGGQEPHSPVPYAPITDDSVQRKNVVLEGAVKLQRDPPSYTSKFK
jgi:hypothetical protein